MFKTIWKWVNIYLDIYWSDWSCIFYMFNAWRMKSTTFAYSATISVVTRCIDNLRGRFSGSEIDSFLWRRIADRTKMYTHVRVSVPGVSWAKCVGMSIDNTRDWKKLDQKIFSFWLQSISIRILRQSFVKKNIQNSFGNCGKISSIYRMEGKFD